MSDQHLKDLVVAKKKVDMYLASAERTWRQLLKERAYPDPVTAETFTQIFGQYKIWSTKVHQCLDEIAQQKLVSLHTEDEALALVDGIRARDGRRGMAKIYAFMVEVDDEATHEKIGKILERAGFPVIGRPKVTIHGYKYLSTSSDLGKAIENTEGAIEHVNKRKLDLKLAVEEILSSFKEEEEEKAIEITEQNMAPST